MVKAVALSVYILNAMNSWVPQASHAYYEKPEITEARYSVIADAISDVVLDPTQTLLFEGTDAAEKTALVVASVASFESTFVADVVNCKRGGDHGLAWGAYQTHSDKAKTCGSLRDATVIALNMMRNSMTHCQRMPLQYKLSVYTNGHCTTSFEAAQRMNRAMFYYSKHKPVVFDDNGYDSEQQE